MVQGFQINLWATHSYMSTRPGADRSNCWRRSSSAEAHKWVFTSEFLLWDWSLCKHLLQHLASSVQTSNFYWLVSCWMFCWFCLVIAVQRDSDPAKQRRSRNLLEVTCAARASREILQCTGTLKSFENVQRKELHLFVVSAKTVCHYEGPVSFEKAMRMHNHTSLGFRGSRLAKGKTTEAKPFTKEEFSIAICRLLIHKNKFHVDFQKQH